MVSHIRQAGLVAGTLLAGLLAGGSNGAGASAPTRLRIEPLSQHLIMVRVSSIPVGLRVDSAVSAEPTGQLVVRTPAMLLVADSVHTLHVVVLVAGAIRLHFAGRASAQERRVAPWGRDITLERAEDGHFRPAWKVHQLP